MALNYWLGDYAAVSQVTRYTVGGTAHTGDTLTLTVNRKTVSYILTGGDTLATAAAALFTLWAAAAFAEAQEISSAYTAGNAYFDLTAITAGMPFTVAPSVTGGGATTTLVTSVIAASTGPSHIDEPNNWSLGATPTGTDDVIVSGGAAMLYGMTSFTVNSWEFRGSYNQQVGLRKWNASGYAEYRTRELTVNGATVRVGTGDGQGISEGYLKGVAGSTWYFEKTGNRATDTVPAIDLGATGTIAAVYISGSSDVGILVEDESTARTTTAVHLSGDSAKLTQGRTSTITTLDMDSGAADLYGVVGTPTIASGAYTHYQGRVSTKIYAFGGYLRLNYLDATGCDIEARGTGQSVPTLDCESNNYTRKFTNSIFEGGAILLDVNKSVTLDSGGTHTADATFFLGSRLGPVVTWNRV